MRLEEGSEQVRVEESRKVEMRVMEEREEVRVVDAKEQVGVVDAGQVEVRATWSRWGFGTSSLIKECWSASAAFTESSATSASTTTDLSAS